MSLLPLVDSFTLERSTNSSDAEGNPYNGWDAVGTFVGFWGSESHQGELNNAGKRTELLDAWISMPFADIRPGDHVVGLRGHDYEVLGVKDLRLHMRVALRGIG